VTGKPWFSAAFKCFKAMFAFSKTSTAGDMTNYCDGFKSSVIHNNLRSYVGNLVLSKTVEETWDYLQKENIFPSREYYLASGFCEYPYENLLDARCKSLRVLEQGLGYAFRNIGLLSAALDDSDPLQVMDPLEYLGDALLDIVILRICAQRYPNERVITQIRSHVVARNFMTRIGFKLNLHMYSLQPCPDVLKSFLEGIESSGLYNPPRNMNKYFVDRLEAITGAIFFDCNLHFGKLEAWLRRLFTPYLDNDLPLKIKDEQKKIKEENQKRSMEDLKRKREDEEAGRNKKRVKVLNPKINN
jgi:dsRNA-specific ribonuclease